MTRTLQGKVRGKTIELEEELGLADGEQVQVQVTAIPPVTTWGQGIARSAGIAADLPGFDVAFAQIQREREQAQYRDAAD